jgi:hypothetical protein
LLYGDGGKLFLPFRSVVRSFPDHVREQRLHLNRKSSHNSLKRSTRTISFNSSFFTSGDSSLRCASLLHRLPSTDRADTLDHREQARKDVSQIFNNLLRRQIGTRWPTVEYLSSKEETIFAALKG